MFKICCSYEKIEDKKKGKEIKESQKPIVLRLDIMKTNQCGTFSRQWYILIEMRNGKKDFIYWVTEKLKLNTSSINNLWQF